MSGSHILSITRAAEDSAERLLLRIVSAKVGELLGELKTWDWTPKTPPPAATSTVIEELMIYLQVCMINCKECFPFNFNKYISCAHGLIIAAGGEFVHFYD